MASSIREYLACPAEGVVSVKFDVSAGICGDGDWLKGAEQGVESGTSLGQGLEKGQWCSERIGRPQGFLEVHKL